MSNQNGERMKRAVGYVRVSTLEQKEEGYSLGGQRENIRQYADRHGYDLINIYADEGISGKNITNRPGVQAMVEDAKNGQFDVLIIWKLTRLGRSMKDVMGIAETLYANNVEFHSISESFDISTSTGKMMLGMLASIAEFERAQISENVQMAMKSLVKDNRNFAGGRMLGYHSQPDGDGHKSLAIVPKEAKIVELIFEKYMDGKGYRAIANALNKMGHKTVKGNPFSSVAVRDILMNPAYCGKLRYNQHVDWSTKRRKGYNPNYILVAGKHEAIIAEELFDEVQAKMQHEARKPQFNNKGENLLTGLLRCPECGGAMAASNTTNTLKDGTKKKMRYYSCANFRNKGASVCHANSIRADEAERFVIDRLKAVISYPEHLKSIVKELNHQLEWQREPWLLEQTALQKSIEEVEHKIERWQVLLRDTPELNDELSSRITELEIELYENRQRLREIDQLLNGEAQAIDLEDVTQVMTLVDQLLTDTDSKKTTKAILRTFVDKVTFNKETKDGIKMYLRFDKPVINQLNNYIIAKDPTANATAVGSFNLPKIMRLVI